MKSAANVAPITWAITYGATSFAGIRPARKTPRVTAGLRCAPETGPIE
jgi:hypothetical protein